MIPEALKSKRIRGCTGDRPVNLYEKKQLTRV
jgi:hypothetical protein